MAKIKKVSIYIVFVICVIFLFAGNPGFFNTRSTMFLWDVGHIVLFTLTSIIIIRNSDSFNQKSFAQQIGLIFIISIVLGVLTELMQNSFNRTPDIYDLYRDLLGAVIGVAFFSSRRNEISLVLRKLLQTGLIILTLIEIYPLSAALFDEALSWSQFPVLSDFETGLEVDRWQNHKRSQVTDSIACSGKHSLQVTLTTSKYSGVSLKYFPSDWHNFRYLHFCAYNPDNDTLRMVCRIHDAQHNNKYHDRFNQAFYLRHGWNEISISLSEVEEAPQQRLMDMRNIELVGLFTVQSPRRRLIFIDNVRLGS